MNGVDVAVPSCSTLSGNTASPAAYFGLSDNRRIKLWGN